jgi:hypothetical protein
VAATSHQRRGVAQAWAPRAAGLAAPAGDLREHLTDRLRGALAKGVAFGRIEVEDQMRLLPGCSAVVRRVVLDRPLVPPQSNVRRVADRGYLALSSRPSADRARNPVYLGTFFCMKRPDRDADAAAAVARVEEDPVARSGWSTRSP